MKKFVFHGCLFFLFVLGFTSCEIENNYENSLIPIRCSALLINETPEYESLDDLKFNIQMELLNVYYRTVLEEVKPSLLPNKQKVKLNVLTDTSSEPWGPYQQALGAWPTMTFDGYLNIHHKERGYVGRIKFHFFFHHNKGGHPMQKLISFEGLEDVQIGEKGSRSDYYPIHIHIWFKDPKTATE